MSSLAPVSILVMAVVTASFTALATGARAAAVLAVASDAAPRMAPPMAPQMKLYIVVRSSSSSELMESVTARRPAAPDPIMSETV